MDNRMEKEDLEINTTEHQVAAFLQYKGIKVDCSNIKTSLSLPRRISTDAPNVKMRLVSRKHKTAILNKGIKLRGTNIILHQ